MVRVNQLTLVLGVILGGGALINYWHGYNMAGVCMWLPYRAQGGHSVGTCARPTAHYRAQCSGQAGSGGWWSGPSGAER